VDDQLPPIVLARTGLMVMLVLGVVGGLAVGAGQLLGVPYGIAWLCGMAAGFLASRATLRWVWTRGGVHGPR